MTSISTNRRGERATTEERRTQLSRRRSGRLGRRGVAVAVMAAVVRAVRGTLVYAAVLPTRDEAAKQVYHASGRVKIKNSLGRDPILGMRNMMPGDRVSGTVKIGNAGRMRARFSLGLSKLIEYQSPAGGRLSYRLVLVIKRLQTKRRPQLVYSGPLHLMPRLQLGTFRPRETRQYKFTVLFPESSPAMDSRFVGAGTSVQFTWYARGVR
jgi:hypothetical protein